MALPGLRRALAGALPSLVAAFLALHQGVPHASPDLLRVGTDVFGSGTGGPDTTGTAIYSAPDDITGWGITTMKGYVPPAPPPYRSPPNTEPSFGAEDFSGNALGGNGFGSNALSGSVGGANLGGSLAPLDQ